MKIALIGSSKIINPKNYLPKECTEILTNIPNLENTVFCSDIDELIQAADYVIVIVNGRSRIPSVAAKCKKYEKSFEVTFI